MEDESFLTTEEVCEMLGKDGKPLTVQGLDYLVEKHSLTKYKRGGVSNRNFYMKCEIEPLATLRKQYRKAA